MEIHATSLQAFEICLHTYIYILDSIHVHFITQTFMSINFTPTYSSFLDSSQLTTSIRWSCYCTCTVHIYVVIDANLCRFTLPFVCMYCRWKIRGGLGSHEPVLPFHIVVPVLIQESGFPSSYVVVFWCSVSLFQWLLVLILVWFVDHHCLEVFVRFFDIRGLVGHHCLQMIIGFVDIGVNCWPSLFRGDCLLC